MSDKRERYDNLDGLRTISCLCIIAYHIKKYSVFQFPGGGIMAAIVDSMTQFVPLFLMISGFGIFCGYYDKMKNKDINISEFYKKRYKKIIPFFAFVMLIDVLIERSGAHIIEALTQSTLVFGLLPNVKMEVCGIGWTLGIIFLFYMLFPYFVFLCDSKKSALISFAVSIMLSVFCTQYFFTDHFVVDGFTPRHNFLYCAPYFLLGGITFLFRESIRNIVQKSRWLSLLICIVVSVGWYFVPNELYGISIVLIKNMIVFALWLWYAISIKSKVLSNKVVNHLSAISLEIYLVQMVIYRGLEKMVGLYFAGDNWLGFLLIWVIVAVADIVFVEAWKLTIKLFNKIVRKTYFKEGNI